MFKRSDGDARRPVTIFVEGTAVDAREGDTVSAALLASNHAFEIARMVVQGALEPELVGAFSASRFGAAGAANNSGY